MALTTVELTPRIGTEIRTDVETLVSGRHDDVPNFAATLNARTLSRTGGSTYFANTYAAYDDLPEEDKQVYDQLRVVHSFEFVQRWVNPEPGSLELAFWLMRTPKVHPLVWKHTSGRKSLVLGSTAEYVQDMDMDMAQGRALLTWDNTGTMHRVDAYPLEEGRMMHRTTIEAEEVLA